MPKHAVQKLQDIENDIKTVISIYDFAVRSLHKNEKFETESRALQPLWNHSISNMHRKSATCETELGRRQGVFIKYLHPKRETAVDLRKGDLKKPGSAPTSSSISSSKESNNLTPWASENAFEQDALAKTKMASAYNNSKGLDFPPLGNEIHMSTSKTLQTASDILTKNNYNNSPKSIESAQRISNSDVEQLENYRSHLNGSNIAVTEVQPDNPPQLPVTYNLKKIKKEQENLSKADVRSRSVSPKKSHLTPKEIVQRFSPPPSKALLNSKTQLKDTSNSFPASPTRSLIAKKVEKLENKRKHSVEDKNRGIDEIKTDGDLKESKPKPLKTGNVKGKAEKLLVGKPDEREQKKFQKNDTSGVFYDQVLQKHLNYENAEFNSNEFALFIEKSNEKLEKMKISKKVALDIAKHLKEKYDEIQISKQELIESVQKIEKDNARLHQELKETTESKLKLEMTIEGLHKESKTRLMELDQKSQEVQRENTQLKAKIKELENEHNETLLQKQQELEEMKKERTEYKNSMMNTETQEEEIKVLSNKKSELEATIEELQSKLEDCKSAKKKLKEKISLLEEELEDQKTNNKKKTEKIKETNKELEALRQNSKDLEAQVKILRKNIENFEEIQKGLTKRTTDYEKEIKSHQEHLNKLHEENSALKTQLENEKDSLLIKAKIIEDQQETIKQLREKSEEAKNLLKKNQSLERILNIERDEKLELQEAVECLKRRKEELKKRIKCLESDLLLAPQEVVRDLQKTQLVLQELENQVQIKQIEWEAQLHSLIKEKEQACSVAEFATKKLMQTTNEFQKQSETFKKLHRIFIQNLAEKEKSGRETAGKVYLQQSQQTNPKAQEIDLINNWLKDKRQAYNNEGEEFQKASCCYKEHRTKTIS